MRKYDGTRCNVDKIDRNKIYVRHIRGELNAGFVTLLLDMVIG